MRRHSDVYETLLGKLISLIQRLWAVVPPTNNLPFKRALMAMVALDEDLGNRLGGVGVHARL